MRSVIVVGGGPAGMLAAISAAREGAHVTLLERNEKLGKKLYITGKGRCNVTNACGEDAFLRNVVHNPRFLYSALTAFPPDTLREKLALWGCPTTVERGDRVFPSSEKASDVTRALERELGRLSVRVLYNARVLGVQERDGHVCGVSLQDGETIPCDAVVLATGGLSYPSTGSTGDGYALLHALGHTLQPPIPALIPFVCEDAWVHGLMGLSLRNVRLRMTQNGKKRFDELGEMMFTHFGVSGPLVLSASSMLSDMDFSDVRLVLDLKPGLTDEQLDARLRRDVGAGGHKELRSLLCGLAPARMALAVAELQGVDARKPCAALTREERARLVDGFKRLPLPVTGVKPLDEAIVTRGGAVVGELSPATMESKLVRGLHVAGELLDVDALTGGFNLHIAFCTGFVAGRAAARP